MKYQYQYQTLGHSTRPRLQNMVQDLFRGRLSNVTRCSVYGMESEASSNIEDLYELELNINDLNNIYQSLEDYFSVEELRGENQYWCHSCRTRVDASRFIKLRQLPSVLNFHLKRYVFIPEMTKKKITSRFSFPSELNMGCQLASGTCINAILIHKGTTADSGHYDAHIEDHNTRQWWEFDDERVSMLGKNPFGRERGSSHSSSVKSSPHAQMEHRKRPRKISNGSHTGCSNVSADGRGEAAMFSSAEAYMLMYILKRGKYGNGVGGDSLPAHLSEHMQCLNASHAKDCREFRRKKDNQLKLFLKPPFLRMLLDHTSGYPQNGFINRLIH